MKRKICCATLAVFVLLSAVLITGCKKEEPVQTQPTQSVEVVTTEPVSTAPAVVRPELAVTGTEEMGDTIQVTTSYCSFAYPFAFSDMLTITVQEEHLVFSAVLDGQEVPAFAVCFDDSGAIPLGELYIAATEETLPVTGVLMQLPEGIEENQASFYAVQEIFNDVVGSLEKDPNFTVAE